MGGNFSYILFFFVLFFSSADIFFKITFFEKNPSGIPTECQTVSIQIRPEILSGLIWVQTFCKDYEQMTKFTACSQRGKVCPDISVAYQCLLSWPL